MADFLDLRNQADFLELRSDGKLQFFSGENTGSATAAANTAINAANSASAASNYFSTKALGEAGTVTGAFFAYPDGAGGLVYAERTALGSDVISIAATRADSQAQIAAAELAETNAAASATASATSATASATSATAAATSATNSATSATAASTAKTAAETARTGAELAETNAENVTASVSAALAAGTVSDLVGTRIYATRALLDADLVPADGLYALVMGDATAANNDLYKKVGATTTGSWTGPLGFFAAASAEANASALAISTRPGFPSLSLDMENGRYHPAAVADMLSAAPRLRNNIITGQNQGGAFYPEIKQIVKHPFGGAVVGAPGTLPTGMSIFNPNGATTEVVAVGADYVDIKFTPPAGAATLIMLVESHVEAPIIGDVYCGSIETQIISGPVPPSERIAINSNYASGPPFSDTSERTVISQTDKLFPLMVSKTYEVAAPNIDVRHIMTLTGGAAATTIRYARPQLIKNASTYTYYLVPNAATASVRAADALTMGAGFLPTAFGTGFLFTVDTWFQPDKITLGGLWQANDAAGNGVSVLQTNGNIEVLVSQAAGGGEAFNLGPALPGTLNVVRVAVSKDKTGASLNGGAFKWLASPTAVIGSFSANMSACRIGNTPVAGPLIGSISKMQFYGGQFLTDPITPDWMVYDCFDREDGPLESPVSNGGPYRSIMAQNVDTPTADPIPVAAEISGGYMRAGAKTATGASPTKAAYPGVDARGKIVGMVARWKHEAGSYLYNESLVLISLRAGRKYVTQIGEGAVHAEFGSGFATWAHFTGAGMSGSTQSDNYGWQHGVDQMNGWFTYGDGTFLMFADGTLERRVLPALTAQRGRYGILEPFRGPTGSPAPDDANTRRVLTRAFAAITAIR